MQRRYYVVAGFVGVLAGGVVYYWTAAEIVSERPRQHASVSRSVENLPSEGEPTPSLGPAGQAPGHPPFDYDVPTPSEPRVIAQIRDTVKSNPKLAEQLAREDRERSPFDPDADERDALLVAAVFNQRQVDRARNEARDYFRRHPNGRFTEYLIQEIGVRPPPPRSDR